MNLPVIAEGATGEAVQALQQLLNLRGAHIAVDGDFGPITAGAVRWLEAAHGLSRDAGIAGGQVWGVLLTGTPA